MTRTPKTPAAEVPRPRRAARTPVPGGPATSPPMVAGGTASLSQPAAATGTPDLAGAVSPASHTAQGRVRAKTPAGGALDADRVLSAGTRAIAATMKEDRGPDSLDAHVRKLMKDLGLTGFHVEKSLDVEKNQKNVSVKGWPDWTIRGPHGVLFRELKSQRGRVEPEQREWLDALTAAGADAGVWRPEDLLSDRIARELAALAGLRAGAA